MLINWEERFETGIGDVDLEHRELVDLINELHGQIANDSRVEAIQIFLGEVFAKISAHFALEESVMRKHDYDEYLAHKKDHEVLLDELRDLMDNSQIDYGSALSTAISDWFGVHFKTKDARLHRKLGV